MIASARPSPAPVYPTRAPASKALPPPPPPRSTSAPNIFKRFTTKLRAPAQPPQAPSTSPHAEKPNSTSPTTVTPSTPATPISAPSTSQAKPIPSPTHLAPPSKPKRLSSLRLNLPKAPAPARAQTNDFLDPAARAAALRERGLRPPRPTLSEQEAALDRRHSVLVPLPEPSQAEQETEARQIRAAWMRQNRVSESAEGLLDEDEDIAPSNEAGAEPLNICTTDAARAGATLVPPSSAAHAVSARASLASFVYPLPASPRRGSTSTRRTADTDTSSRSRTASGEAAGTSPPGLSTSLSTSSTAASVPRTPYSADARSKALPERPAEGACGVLSQSPVDEPEEMGATEMGETVEAQVERERQAVSKKPSRLWRTARERTTPALTVTVHPPPRPSSSLTNLRRAVASVARRPKSLVASGAETRLDPRTLPPSPTFPPSAYHTPPYPPPSPSDMSSLGAPSSHHSAQSPTSATFGAVPRPRPRQALSPTIHSRGSILLGTRGIADDESRRLSEMAFLD